MFQPTVFEKLLILASESTVMVSELSADEGLMALLRDESVSQEQALAYVNENY